MSRVQHLPELVTLPPTALPRFVARGLRERWAERVTIELAEVSDDEIAGRAYAEMMAHGGALLAAQWVFLVKHCASTCGIPSLDSEWEERMLRVCPACGLPSSVKVTGRCERCCFTRKVE